MGRTKRHHKYLPARLRLKHRTYYYVAYSGGRQVWTRLAADLPTALKLWAKYEAEESYEEEVHGETVSQALKRYLACVVPGLAPATQVLYRGYAPVLDRVFGEVLLAEVKSRHIAQFLDRSSRKTMANRQMAMLSSIYAYAMRWGWCDNNPCRGVRRNKEVRRDRYVTDSELSAIVAVAPPQLAAIISVAYLTAMRRKDLLAIRLSDLTVDGIVVQQSKSGKKQCFTWSAALRETVNTARALRRRVGSLHLFANTDGQALGAGTFGAQWRRAVGLAGIEDIHFHDIRAKALTDGRRERGVDYAKALGGHASTQMTDRYTKGRGFETVEPLK